MNHSFPSKTREHLEDQLVFFGKQYSVFLEAYFPEQRKEKVWMEKLVRSYMKTLEAILKNDDDALAQSLQKTAILGSSVTISYQDDGSHETFTVVHPTEIDPDKNRISCLSPIGRQLLLASSGDSLTLETPVSNHKIVIEEVKHAYIGGFGRGDSL